MKKLVALFAATVMTMSLSVSAFAASVKSDGSDLTDNTFNLVFTADTGDAAKDQLTMIAYLVPADTQENAIPDYSSQLIVAIDQVGGNAGFGTVPVEVSKLAGDKAIAVAMGDSTGTVAKYLIKYNEEEETVILYGDVDGNDKVNLKDLSTLKRHLNSWTGYEVLANPDAADVDENDKVNLKDLSNLKRHLNSWTGYETLPIK